MPIQFECICGTKVEVSDRFIDKRVQCPICKRPLSAAQPKPKPWWEDHQESLKRIIGDSQTNAPNGGVTAYPEADNGDELDGLNPAASFDSEEFDQPEAAEADRAYPESARDSGVWRWRMWIWTLLIGASVLLLALFVFRSRWHTPKEMGNLRKRHEARSAEEGTFLSRTEEKSEQTFPEPEVPSSRTVPPGKPPEQEAKQTLSAISRDTRTNSDEESKGQDVEPEVPQKKEASAFPGEIQESGRNFTVNVASFRDKERADRYAEDLRGKGFETLTWGIELPQRGRWYRVSIGRFPTLEQAQQVEKDLVSQGFTTFVTRLPAKHAPADLFTPRESEAEESPRSHGTPENDLDMRRLLRS